jgi:plastocyanin
MFASSRVKVAAWLVLVGLAAGHRSLPSGVTCGNQFASSSTALEVPNPAISWASYRILTCDAPVFWLKAQDVSVGQNLSFTITAPVIGRFAGVRVSVLVIGPGLSNLSGTEQSQVPADVLADIPDGEGAALFTSPEDQSSCAHLGSDMMTMASDVSDGRCHFHEPYGDTHSWVLLDDMLTASAGGTFHFAIFTSDGSPTKLAFACCDWPEDFTTDYPMPAAECPYCGTMANFSSWDSHFYETKAMAEYGGFPAAGNNSCSVIEANCSTGEVTAYLLDSSTSMCSEFCATSGILALMPGGTEGTCSEAGYSVTVAEQTVQGMYVIVKAQPGPSEAQCPNETQAASAWEQLAESCSLGCSSEECHSHNIFGECTYPMQWVIPKPHINDYNVTSLILFKGEKVHFTSAGMTGLNSVHNLMMMESESKLELCDFSGSTQILSVGEVLSGTSVTFDQEGTFYYSCGMTGHCGLGQKLTVEVKDVTEGMRCHDHAATDAEVELLCEAGNVNAHVLDNSEYGAGTNQCSEFCTPLAGLAWIAGGTEGTCSEAGYSVTVAEQTVQPTGSPMTIDVIVKGMPDADISCQTGEIIARVLGNTDYGAEVDQCTEFCTPAAYLALITGATEGACSVAGYTVTIAEMSVQPPGLPMAVNVIVKGTESASCHCHSYEEIACSSAGDGLYDEHIDEIQTYCQEVISGADVVCPYKCFQPFEVLHLHYLECSLRSEHSLYAQVAATNMCHLAATAPSADDCGQTTTTEAPTGPVLVAAAYTADETLPSGVTSSDLMNSTVYKDAKATGLSVALSVPVSDITIIGFTVEARRLSAAVRGLSVTVSVTTSFTVQVADAIAAGALSTTIAGAADAIKIQTNIAMSAADWSGEPVLTAAPTMTGVMAVAVATDSDTTAQPNTEAQESEDTASKAQLARATATAPLLVLAFARSLA